MKLRLQIQSLKVFAHWMRNSAEHNDTPRISMPFRILNRFLSGFVHRQLWLRNLHISATTERVWCARPPTANCAHMLRTDFHIRHIWRRWLAHPVCNPFNCGCFTSTCSGLPQASDILRSHDYTSTNLFIPIPVIGHICS